MGLTIAEIACPELASARDPVSAAIDRRFEAAVEHIVRPLIARAPAARPSAQWVHVRAASELGWHETPQAARARRRQAVRRAYLAIRRRELLSSAQHCEARITVTGEPGKWLADIYQLGYTTSAFVELARSPSRT